MIFINTKKKKCNSIVTLLVTYILYSCIIIWTTVYVRNEDGKCDKRKNVNFHAVKHNILRRRKRTLKHFIYGLTTGK